MLPSDVTVTPPKKDISTWKGAKALAGDGPFTVEQIANAYGIPNPEDEVLLKELRSGKFKTSDEFKTALDRAKGPMAEREIIVTHCEIVLTEEAMKA